MISRESSPQGSYPSGGRRYEKIARFSTVDLVKAGCMQKSKGIWTPSDVGREAYDEFTDATLFDKRAVQLYLEWKASPGPTPLVPSRLLSRSRSSGARTTSPSTSCALLCDDVGLFVTTGGFTKDAQDEARTQEKRKITLIDRQRLVELWIEYMDRLGEDARRLLPLKLAPEEIGIEEKDGALASYQFDTKVARHYFCKICGIYPFHQTLRKPGHYRVNLGCIDDVDTNELPVELFDGKSL